MAPKAMSARKRFNPNHRFRGHGPLLQAMPSYKAMPYRCPALCRASSIFPIWLRCTSSGPSAMRSVRELA